MHDNDSSHPISAQLKILKNRLDQKGRIIKILGSCIQIQQTALLSIVEQFEQHQCKIMRRLHRLQQINLRYIKDYLQIKKQNKVQDFVPIEHMFAGDPKQFIKHKMQTIKQIKTLHQQSAHLQAKKTVNTCIHLMKNYLTDRKVNYDRLLAYFSEQRKKKMKESKGLEGYRQNKEQAKFIEALKVKIDKFGKRIQSIDNGNVVQVFHSRQEIQRDLNRLDPVRGQITLQQSRVQQDMFKSMIQELISYNSVESQEEIFLHGSFNYINDRFESLCQTYGVQFINESIQSMKNLSSQAKHSIINNRFKSLHSLSKGQTYPVSENYGVELTREEYGQHKDRINKKLSRHEQDLQDQQQQDSQYLQNRKLRKVNKSKANNRLDETFQKAKTKTFFQQQQKSRDQLISKQQQQIAQHEKVIDKLINFIKKQFKDLNMNDIDADDPQQLIGYYFKMNQKKYVDIRQEMQQIQSTNASNAKKVHSLTYEKEQLAIRVNSLQEQMKQLLQKYQKSTFQFHILISSTQDLVKISLQTLINTCMNNITPQELISQLQKIISLIKDNIEKKRNITYKLTVKEEHIQSNEPKETKKDYIAQPKDKDSEILGQMLVNFMFKQTTENNQSLFSAILQPQKLPSEKEQVINSEQISKPQNVIKMEDQPNKADKEDKAIDGGEQQPKVRGFDESFLKTILRQFQIIKDKNKNANEQIEDIKQMYSKYKQALDCLERAQHLNRQNQIKYQHFISGLKKKGAWGCPQKLQEKLFYMQKLINQQNQLLQNQRAQYQETILKQVKQSQNLANNVLKRLKIKKRETTA